MHTSTHTIATQPLVDWLANPANHPDGPQHVEIHETHISWVFLTRTFAYKLKKPVRFDFLDFRNLEDRRVACEDEVRLNRRLAPDVYLGVVPVCRAAEGQFALDAAGEPIDWLVKMRRLDASRRCDVLLEHGTPDEEERAALVDALARFYRHAPAVAVSPGHYVSRFVEHVLANRAALLASLSEPVHSLVKRVHADQLVLLHVFPDGLQDRVCEGRVIEGHGDLRPEHIYFPTGKSSGKNSPPKIVDCIEFSQDYRTVDVADDLSFFAMECAALGRADFGRQVLDECLTAIDDQAAKGPARELIDFYIGYRACVRAKVAASGPAQWAIDGTGAAERALHYIHLADSHAVHLGPPWLLVVCGGVGTGKSTLATRLCETLGFELLQSDAVRRELLGSRGAGEGLDEGIYSRGNRLRIYHEIYERAARLLDERVPVVIDASFQLPDAWPALQQLLMHTSARVLAVHCRTSPDLARRRIEARLAGGASESDARPEMVRDANSPPLNIPANIPRVLVDTANSPAVLADCVYRRMRH